MNILKYYLRDAREGISRNKGAAFATVLLIFISLTITGVAILFKSSVNDIVTYLNGQVKIKVFVDTTIVNTKDVENILKKNPYIASTSIETKEETLEKLKPLFDNKDYLFKAFQKSHLPDAIIIDLKDKKDIEIVAKELKKTNGISDVIYAQKFAQKLIQWTTTINTYGIVVVGVFILSSFLTVSISINLALYQRQKDIRVKLLLGAKEKHVRAQFLFEGFLLGMIGSLLASFVLYFIYQQVLFQLQVKFSTIFFFNDNYINIVMLAIVVGGSLIGVLGSFLSTRRLMKHA